MSFMTERFSDSNAGLMNVRGVNLTHDRNIHRFKVERTYEGYLLMLILYFSLACRCKHGEVKSELWSPGEMQRKDRKEVLDMKMTFSCGSEAAPKALLLSSCPFCIHIFMISLCMTYCTFLAVFCAFH